MLSFNYDPWQNKSKNVFFFLLTIVYFKQNWPDVTMIKMARSNSGQNVGLLR